MHIWSVVLSIRAQPNTKFFSGRNWDTGVTVQVREPSVEEIAWLHDNARTEMEQQICVVLLEIEKIKEREIMMGVYEPGEVGHGGMVEREFLPAVFKEKRKLEDYLAGGEQSRRFYDTGLTLFKDGKGAMKLGYPLRVKKGQISSGNDQYEAEFYAWWIGAHFAEMFYKKEKIPEGTFEQNVSAHGGL